MPLSIQGSCAQRAKARLGALAGSLDSVCPDPSSLQWWPAGDSLPGAGVLSGLPAGPQTHSLPGNLQGQALTESPEYEPGQRLGQGLRDHKARPGESGDPCSAAPLSTPGGLGWTGHGGFHGAMPQPSCLPACPNRPKPGRPPVQAFVAAQGGWALTSRVREPREEEAQMPSGDKLGCWSRSAGPTVAKRQGGLRPRDTQVSSALGTRPKPGALRGCREQLLRPVPGPGVSAPEGRPQLAATGPAPRHPVGQHSLRLRWAWGLP